LDVRAGTPVTGTVATTGEPPGGVDGTAAAALLTSLGGVGGTAVALITSLCRVGGGGDSATVAPGGEATGGEATGGEATVVGAAMVVAGAGVLRMVVVTGTGVVVGKAASGGFGAALVVTGVSAGVDVTVSVAGGGVTTGFGCRGGAMVPGVTVTGEACGGGAEGMSGTRTGCGVCLARVGGLTRVVDGPVNGSASTGAVPPVIADNEIAVPDASNTTTPRPLHVRKAARIAPRLSHR
jgi:hypothetical protein